MIRLSATRWNKYAAFSVTQLLAAALVVGLVATPVARAKDPSTVPALKRVEAKSQAAAAKMLAATVGIINQSIAGGGSMGEGSGVVVSEDGLVITAGHVLGQPGAELTLIFPDGRRVPAKALGINFTRDAGLAKITEPGKWPHVEMGRSDDIKAGAWCMALGHPGGVQKGRTPPIRLGRILLAGNHARFLVSDATVISGDSGGPLFDLDGRVIGIHSNIGFSVNQNQHVPIDVFRTNWDDLLAGKTIGVSREMQLAEVPSPEKFERFQELFLERMMAGDPEALGLIKDGQFHLTPDDIDRLIAKWEKLAPAAKPSGTPAAPAGAASAADEPLDFLKLQRLFQERLAAGDPQTQKRIKDGKMMVKPSELRQLMDEWEKKSLAESAKPKPGEAASKAPADKAPTDKGSASKAPADKGSADKAAGPAEKPPERKKPAEPPIPPKVRAEALAKLREAMRNAVPQADGRLRLRGIPEMDGLLRDLPGLEAVSRAVNYGKSNPQLLKEIGPIAAQAGRSTVVVLCDGKPAALGTVVRKDGYILTKASELHGKVACKIGTRVLPATVVKNRFEHDLSLIKVEATDLTPVVWAEGEAPAPGSWLLTPGADNDALGLGIVSIAARDIPDAPTMLLRNRAIVGVMLDETAKNAVVRFVSPGLPAAAAGLQAGDVIEKIDGQAVSGAKDVNQCLGKYKPGDKIAMQIAREGKPLNLNIELVSSDRMAPKSNGDHLTRLSEAGGTVSKRRSRFVQAFTHDTVLQAGDCGGPIVNLDGQAVGLNIARADRTATYAIPARMLRMLVPEMLPK